MVSAGMGNFNGIFTRLSDGLCMVILRQVFYKYFKRLVFLRLDRHATVYVIILSVIMLYTLKDDEAV